MKREKDWFEFNFLRCQSIEYCQGWYSFWEILFNTNVFNLNKILYKKIVVNGIDAFEYSNNSTDELYNVRFTLVGTNLGNYILINSSAIGFG